MAVDGLIEKCRDLEGFYKINVFENLEGIAFELRSEISDLIDAYYCDPRYKLSLKNSIYDKIKLYDVLPRVKEPESLYEKLIRKNLVFDMIEIWETGTLNKDKALRKIELMDDVIGIKIVTNLSVDCGNVFKLLENHIEEKVNIKLDLNDKIPEKMRNGREIYKVKGTYKDQYSFELQIKSKIDSAWGDLEHNLFYKDYDYNYIKNNNKRVMNNVGNLLEEIEGLMLTIRGAKQEFTEDYDKIKFYNDIIGLHKERIKSSFGTDQLLEDHIDLLFYLKTKLDGDDNDFTGLCKEERLYNYYDYNLEQVSSLAKNYKQMRDSNFQLMAIENIYLNCFEGIHTDRAKVIEKITTFIELTIDRALETRSSVLGKRYVIGYLSSSIMKFMKCATYDFKGINFLFDMKLFNILVNSLVIANETIDEYYDEGSDDFTFDLEDVNKDLLKDDVNNKLFELIYSQKTYKELEVDSDDIDIIDIKMIISEVKGKIKKSLENEQDDKLKGILSDNIKKLEEFNGGE